MKPTFQRPQDIIFNTAKIADPSAFARANAAASWLYDYLLTWRTERGAARPS